MSDRDHAMETRHAAIATTRRDERERERGEREDPAPARWKGRTEEKDREESEK